MRDAWSLLLRVVSLIVLLAWFVLIVYPMIWCFLGSVKDNPQLYSNPWGIPREWHFENYTRAWREANIGGFFFNSVVVTAFSVAGGVFLAVFAAYVIARFSMWLTRFVFWILTASMMLPVILTLVPKFLLLRRFGLLDSRLGLILIYVASGIPFGVFLMESFYHHLPRDFEDSAYLDGASHFQTFRKVIIPVSSAGMMVVSIFLFLRSWNEIYHAMIMLSSPRKFTIPIGMLRLIEIQQYAIEWGPILAGVVMVIVPIIAFYIAAQRNIVEGLTSGAIKG